jgi:hypothetical protein
LVVCYVHVFIIAQLDAVVYCCYIYSGHISLGSGHDQLSEVVARLCGILESLGHLCSSLGIRLKDLRVVILPPARLCMIYR